MLREHVSTVRVRYADTDQMRVVHHANYLAYMEEARTLMFEELGSSYAAFELGGSALAVRRAELRYRRPARYGDALLVHTSVTALRKASVVFAYRIEDASGAALCDGSTELACVDLDGLRPQALPAQFVALLQSWLGTEA